MNYWERHIGDWLKDTTGLSFAQDGAYARLCDVYYSQERPLPVDVKECCDLARARDKRDRNVVTFVLKKFFRLAADGWHHKRIDEEIEKVHAKSEKARMSAKSRWNGSDRNANASDDGMRTHLNGHATAYANASETHAERICETDALQSPSSNLQSPSKNLTPLPPLERGVNSRNGSRAERNAERDAAIEVWNKLIASDGAEPKRNPTLQAAIDAVGGWSRIAQRQEGTDAAFVRKQFCDAYRSAAT